MKLMALYYLIINVFLLVSFTVESKTGLETVQSSCIEKIDWSKKQCEVQSNDQYYLGVTEKVISRFLTIPTEKMISVAHKILYKFLENESYDDLAVQVRGKSIRDELRKMMKFKVENKKISTCQKSCLLKCVTSHFIKYKPINMSNRKSHIEQLYTQGIGDCFEFSRISNDLSDILNLETRGVYNLSKQHAYNEVKVNGQWLYFDPQTDDCSFYLTKNLDELGEKYLEDISVMNERSDSKLVFVHGAAKVRDFSNALMK